MSTFPPDAPTRSFFARPAPHIDPRLTIDPVVRLLKTSDALSFETASQETLAVRLRLVDKYALRLTVTTDRASGTAPKSVMLADFHEAAPHLAPTENGFRIEGLDREVELTHEGRVVIDGNHHRSLRIERTHRPRSQANSDEYNVSDDAERANPWLVDAGTPAGSTESEHTVAATVDGTQAGWLVAGGLSPAAEVYGTGESFHGPALRGRLLRLVNLETDGIGGLDNSYLNVPFVWTDDGWGIFVHAGAPLLADLAHAHGETLALQGEMTVLDAFIFVGSAPEILSAYHTVTGLPGSFPDWGLGVWTSRCSYLNAAEVRTVIEEYKTAGCPIDVVHIDAWGEGNLMHELTTPWRVDRRRWPEGWSKPVRDAGVRVSLWHNPYLLVGSPAAQEATARGYVVVDDEGMPVTTNDRDNRLLVDFTNSDATRWWRAQVRRLVESEGAHAMKADFAEEVPAHARFADGRNGWDMRNEYAVLYQRATSEAINSASKANDVALFSRSGTAGAQRYPCHWVGDSPATWDGFTGALRSCLSLSLSGFAFVASDIGGFWTEQGFNDAFAAFDEVDPSHFRADVDGELFVRWTQFGALSPVMRFHGLGRREPHAYPEPYRTLAIEACRYRAHLRQYLGFAAAEASMHGVPMMRPMPLAYPGDPAARSATLQYMLGPDLLCAPVTQPGGHTRVYVPYGKWAPLKGGPRLSGPAWVDLELPLETIPAWHRQL